MYVRGLFCVWEIECFWSPQINQRIVHLLSICIRIGELVNTVPFEK